MDFILMTSYGVINVQLLIVYYVQLNIDYLLLLTFVIKYEND